MKNKTIALAGAGLVAAAALALGGAALASADETGSDTGTTARGAHAQAGELPGGAGMHGNGNTDPGKPMRSDETLLTGETAAKVTAAARAKEPTATIQRVETDSDGVYEAHLVRTDGTPVTVKVDASFAVTSVQEGAPGAMGRDGTGSMDGSMGMGGMGVNGHGARDGDGQHGMTGQSGEAPASPDGPTPATPSST